MDDCRFGFLTKMEKKSKKGNWLLPETFIESRKISKITQFKKKTSKTEILPKRR
jgi:hypothetical protein